MQITVKYILPVALIATMVTGCHLLRTRHPAVLSDAQRIAAITSISSTDKARLTKLSLFTTPKEIKKITEEEMKFFIACIESSMGKPDASDIMGMISQVVGSDQFEATGVPDERWIQLARIVLTSCEKAPNLTKELQNRHQIDALRYASYVKNPSMLDVMKIYKGKMVNEKVERRLGKLLSQREGTSPL